MATPCKEAIPLGTHQVVARESAAGSVDGRTGAGRCNVSGRDIGRPVSCLEQLSAMQAPRTRRTRDAPGPRSRELVRVTKGRFDASQPPLRLRPKGASKATASFLRPFGASPNCHIRSYEGKSRSAVLSCAVVGSDSRHLGSANVKRTDAAVGAILDWDPSRSQRALHVVSQVARDVGIDLSESLEGQ